MLDKRTRKKLETQKFLDKGEEKNPSQFLDRVTRQSIRAMSDLVLVAEKMPEAKLDEIFSPDTVDRFVDALLGRITRRDAIEVMGSKVNKLGESVKQEQDPQKNAKLQDEWIKANHQFEMLIRPINRRRMRLARVLAADSIRYCNSEYMKVERNLALFNNTSTPLLNAIESISGIVARCIEASYDIDRKLETGEPEWAREGPGGYVDVVYFPKKKPRRS